MNMLKAHDAALKEYRNAVARLDQLVDQEIKLIDIPDDLLVTPHFHYCDGTLPVTIHKACLKDTANDSYKRGNVIYNVTCLGVTEDMIDDIHRAFLIADLRCK